MKKIFRVLPLCAVAGSMLFGCGSAPPETLTVLAAASLTDVCEALKTAYEADNPSVSLTYSFASSGALQAQIEEGAPADVFLSAGIKQMDALCNQGLMKQDSVTNLLENRIVLIVPQNSDRGITAFEDVATDKVRMIGLGDPESVPAGQYADQIFSALQIDVGDKANYGTDVRTVLSWVAAGEVDCGVVYNTDALSTEAVEVVAEAAPDLCDPVIYPVGIVEASTQSEQAAAFVDFLQSDAAAEIFTQYGFTVI